MPGMLTLSKIYAVKTKHPQVISDLKFNILYFEQNYSATFKLLLRRTLVL